MKIDYITAHSPLIISSWSGLNYFILCMLEDNGRNEVNIITSLQAKPCLKMKIVYRWYRLFGKNYQYERTHCYAKQFGRQASKQLSPDADIVFTTYAPVIPYLNTSKPLLLYTDATFHNLAEYYQHFSSLSRVSKTLGDAVEAMALQRCSHIFLASAWAAEAVISHYSVSASHCTVVPFGANLLQVPGADQVHRCISEKTSSTTIQLLVLGVEFRRKGGFRAMAIAEHIRQKGVSVNLVVAGIEAQPPEACQDWVTWVGPVNKEQDHDRLDQLFASSHFLLVPSEQECFGVVYAEANAWGVPAIGNDTGGVSSAIENGYNGLLLNGNETPEETATRILDYWRNKALFVELCQQSRTAYEERYNWQVVSSQVFAQIRQILR